MSSGFVVQLPIQWILWHGIIDGIVKWKILSIPLTLSGELDNSECKRCPI